MQIAAQSAAMDGRLLISAIMDDRKSIHPAQEVLGADVGMRDNGGLWIGASCPFFICGERFLIPAITDDRTGTSCETKN